MATLTEADAIAIWLRLFVKGLGKEEFGKGAVALPTNAQRLAMMQAMEDRFVAAFQSAKGDIETILGRSLTNAAMLKAFRAYYRWRDSKGG